MIKLQTVLYKNFMGVGEVPIKIELSKYNTTAIFGKNGSGKTSFVDAITFCLFGKPFRKINKPQLVNSVNNKNCYCELEFIIGNVNFKICRGIKPNIFEIYRNGKLLDQRSRSKDQQTYLEENILKLNYRSFCQIIVLGTANFVPFMQLSAAERRYIIEDLLDIKVFSDMNVLLKEKASKLRDDLNTLENRIEIKGEKLKLHRKFVSESKTSKNNKIKDSKIKIKESNKKRKELEKQIKIFQNKQEKLLIKTKDYVIMKDESEKYNQQKSQALSLLKKLKEDIEYYKSTDSCGECKQEIQEDFRKSTIEKKKKKIELVKSKLPELEDKLKETFEKLKQIEEYQTEIYSIQENINKLNNQVYILDQVIQHIQTEIDKIIEVKEKDSQIKEEQIEELENNKKELENQKSEYIDKRYTYDIVSMMLKDSGIKTKIIQQYLPIMNKLINKYLNQMNFFVNFNLDDNFKEVIKTRNKEDYSYESFSGGERTKINLAILFAWREIAKMKNAANTNLLIFDEIMDSSLDNDGLDDFVKLIQTVSKGTNVFVISHRNAEGLQDKFDSIIKFEKIKGFTVKQTGV